MKKFYVLAGLALALVGAWGWVAGWWTPDPLVLGTHAEFRPFALRDGDDGQDIVGFDVELAKAIAEKARRPLKIVDLPAEGLIPALEAGDVDLVLAAMAITEERAARVDFSASYYKATPVVLIRDGDPEPAEAMDMRGRKMAAHLGTPSDGVARDITGHENVRQTPTAKAAIVHLLNSQVDFVLVDEQPVSALQARFPEARMVRLPFKDEFLGVAVRQGNAELLDLVNQTLQDVVADGRYDGFIDRWMVQAN